MRSRDLPGLRTEAIARPPGTVALDQPDCRIWDTPDFRSTWWGHALIPDRAPKAIEPWLDRWRAVHEGKGVGRAILCWEARLRRVPDLPAGAEHEALWTLMCDKPLTRVPGPAAVGALTHDDLPAIDALALALGEEPVSMGWAVRGWLDRAAAGQGTLWGGWVDDQLVAVTGLFHDDREARTQWIATHPDHRRRGLCRQILSHAVHHHQDHHPGIVYTTAVADGVAEQLYRDLGWRRVTAMDCVTLEP